MFYNSKLNRIFLFSCSSDDDSYDDNDNLYSSDDNENENWEDIENEYYNKEPDQEEFANHLFRRGYGRQRSESMSKIYTQGKEEKSSMPEISEMKEKEASSSSSRNNRNRNWNTIGSSPNSSTHKLQNEIIKELSNSRNRTQSNPQNNNNNNKERSRTSSSYSKLFNTGIGEMQIMMAATEPRRD